MRIFSRQVIASTLLLAFSNVATGFQQPKQPLRVPSVNDVTESPKPESSFLNVATKSMSHAAATATLAVLLTTCTPLPALASPTAAQISLDSIPPTSISVEVGDLPVVGNLLSGTYMKVDPAIVKDVNAPPSVVIKSPKDKIKAIQAAATAGHLEFDIGGKTGLKTHMDVDIAAEEPGVAKVVVTSNLIPKLPFKNLASASGALTGKESQWSVVTNMGNGETYYFNSNTGETTFDKPNKI